MFLGFFRPVATPSLGQKKIFGAKIIKNHVFRAWGRKNRIPDIKIMQKSLRKLKKDLQGVKNEPKQCPATWKTQPGNLADRPTWPGQAQPGQVLNWYPGFFLFLFYVYWGWGDSSNG